MKKLAALFCLLFSFAAHAATTSWVIDAARSTISFDDVQAGQKFTGGFKKFTGVIAFDPAQLTQSHAAITINMTSISVGGDGDQYIAAPAWLDSAKFPTATFKTTGFEKTAGGYIAHGKLTIRDVTLPLDLPFTLTFSPDGKIVTMQGSTTIRRLDYHIGTGEWADAKTVALDIPARVNVFATKTP